MSSDEITRLHRKIKEAKKQIKNLHLEADDGHIGFFTYDTFDVNFNNQFLAENLPKMQASLEHFEKLGRKGFPKEWNCYNCRWLYSAGIILNTFLGSNHKRHGPGSSAAFFTGGPMMDS
ncbi:hypothetical protein [Magnetovibrio blakemorei]|uniref:Uncharacterized protein n=1 Tax=Magnetovibrio blakemorei TaxID=28181 RepID=A0A1E5Q3U6_9PROT|nr:hypothetical protein [Magnetovibrio blakemorei]OEJ64576.1 hypothetical protein BEN30_16235 [Magnetovibrio blakemorei]